MASPCDRKRMRVRHFKNRRDAAENRCAAAGFQIFLMGRSWFSEMHLTVDHAR